MGVVGGVLAHRVIGVAGWEDVQLPTVLSAALTHRLRKQEVTGGAVGFSPARGLCTGLETQHLPEQ